MADIKDQLIKDSYNYVLQSDLSTGVVYRIGGAIPVNPIFSSGLTINDSFVYSGAGEQNGYVLFTDGTGLSYWGAISGLTYYVSASTPTGVSFINGDRWFDTTTGDETVWINDGVGLGQWVQPNNGGGGGGSGLMGSGTTDYLTIWSSQNTLSASSIYFDGTNYNIPNLSAGTITSQNYQGNLVTDIQEGFGIDVDQSTGSVTITNTKPDVDVVLNQGDGIDIISTYPSFNISNTDRGSSQNIFKNITIDTNTQFSANDNNDTLNFSGIGISITSDVASKTLIFSAETSSQSVSGEYLPLSGGTVTGGTIFQSGLTANTISATTYYNLPPIYQLTGGTYSAGTIDFNNTTGGTSFSVTGLSKYFVTGSTPTGYTLIDGDRWFDTNTGIELVWITDINSSQWIQPTQGGEFIGNYLPLSGGTVTGGTIFQSGLTANTLTTFTTGFTHNNSIGVDRYSGEVVRFGAGTTYASILYYYDSSGNWSFADSNSTSTSTGMLGIGISANYTTPGSPTTSGILVRGFARLYYGGWSTGDKLYIAADTSGGITNVAPTTSTYVVRIVGYVVDGATNLIYFCPDNTWVQLV